ncbi:SDR family NAD(P)-dependent oxidoreductase [Cereibacter sphaeroides]|uniref:SDR family NAD(P)-dependent oxidoreductase n=1 Tax=Cereibacter sphaeroides TaxID=1063 RepID=UPI003FCE9FC5
MNVSGDYLDGKVVLVTGGASGIGRSVAEVCVELGARTAICDLAPGEAPEGQVALNCDVTDPAAVERAFAAAREAFGRVDAVVNCAGVWRPRSDGPITAVSDETWDRIIAVNLTGTFNVCREAVRVMETQGHGSIVTIASVVAITGWEKLNAYSASKGGVLSLSRALAIECGPKNIRVNCICPGVIETPMTEKVLAYSQPDVLPIGRLGHPRDIAHTAAFLCSDRSGFTTAATVVVDGGFSAA